ncbi:hypothetical protein V5F77_00045 [Xanthobacter sp. DSM 24535]|uniref:hypothetical protein n=1 Tax=Roseixanthobacter psychrophilus TaxID=3119917 RepID=UPI00372668F4
MKSAFHRPARPGGTPLAGLARALRPVPAVGLVPALACAFAACLLVSAPALSQDEGSAHGLGITGDSNPFPFDARLEINKHLQSVLPTLWWSGAPEYRLEGFTVTVHIPASWQGNPTSALMRLCPQAHSTLWQGIKRLELQPYYKNATWAGVTCRP